MTESFGEQLDKRYGDRGGWRVLDEIFRARLPYETKIDNAQVRYLISRATAVRWYGRWRALTHGDSNVQTNGN